MGLSESLYPYRGVGFDGWGFLPSPLASGGWKAADLAAATPAWIAGATRVPEWALVDIGVNDLPAGTTQVSYEASLSSVLDAIHAAWPSCVVLVARPWMRFRDTEANAMAGWIDNVLATRGAFAAVGHDERIWLKGADNGATMSTDGTHYSAAGMTECAAQWKTLMGF